MSNQESFTFTDRAVNGTDFFSDAIQTLAYHHKAKKLYISFVNGGEYVYDGVNESTYNLFKEADSLGTFYRKYVSGNFPSERKYSLRLRASELKNAGVTQVRTSAPAPAPAVPAQAAPTSRYGVKWANGILTFEPVFKASDETDALRQFNAQIALLDGTEYEPDEVKVLAVSHYFD